MTTSPIRLARGRPLAAVVLAALLVLPASAAGAAQSFTFFGGGWGHGIGMSQYGAYGLAQKGWSADRILRHYYTGVKVESRTPPKSRIRVGLLQHRGGVTVTAVGGSLELRLSGGTAVDTVPSGASRTLQVREGRFRVLRAGGAVVGGTLWGGSTNHLQIRRTAGAAAGIAEWGHSLGRGYAELRVAGSEQGHLAAVLKPEHYLYGLGEVPSSWPAAALQAQAIAGRTYTYRAVSDGRSGCACDILGDTRDQAYVGWEKEAGTAGDRWVKAVDATAKIVVTHGGAPISTLYTSSSGGFTEHVENVWGGTPLPYLRGRCDPGDFVASNPNRVWKVTLSGVDAASKLRSALGWSVAEVTGFAVDTRGVSGRVVGVTVTGKRSSGASFSASTSGWKLRGALGLKDSLFWVNADRRVTGPIRAEYDRLGCRPGRPTSAARSVAGGEWQKFRTGRIYRGAGAVWVRGSILTAYLDAGGPTGKLGFPAGGQKKLSGERVRMRFASGLITCRPDGSCRVRST